MTHMTHFANVSVLRARVCNHVRDVRHYASCVMVSGRRQFEPERTSSQDGAHGAQAQRAIDWAAIEAYYRLGQFPLREIAACYGVSHSTILRRAAKGEWKKEKVSEVRRWVRAQLRPIGPRTSGPDHETGTAERGTAQQRRMHSRPRMKGLAPIAPISTSAPRYGRSCRTIWPSSAKN
jgi:hypothetical protein